MARSGSAAAFSTYVVHVTEKLANVPVISWYYLSGLTIILEVLSLITANGWQKIQ